MKTIDYTPTWLGILPVLIEMINNGNKEQKEYVISELKRLCIIADKVNIMKTNLL